MSKEKITIKLPRVKYRHYMLFSEDTPFKPKVVNKKDVYRRNSKHKNQDRGEMND